MNIFFFIQGKKELVKIYIRMRDSNIDAKALTGKVIDRKQFKKGAIRQIDIPKNASVELKNRIKIQNKNLTTLESELNTIKENVINAYNNKQDYEVINTDWLKRILKPNINADTPTTLVGYFDYYIAFKKNSLRKSTLKKLNVFKNRIINYKKDFSDMPIYIHEVNRRFSISMQKWCDGNGYAHNTKVKTLKVILTICNFAAENDTPTSADLRYITKGLKYIDSPFVTLSFDEIEQIIETNILDERLSIAKDWLIISCYTAQRVSDNLYLKKENIVFQNGEYILQTKQEKTNNPISITLNDEVMKILNKRNGNFPPVFSSNKESNKTIYNKLIKEVCKIAKINDTVKAIFKNTKTNRYETKEVPKYKAIASHIGRRSYASNYYGIIDTSLLIGQTGHKTEKQFLRYVQKEGAQNSLRLATEMRKAAEERKRIKEQQAKIRVVNINNVG